MMWLIAGLAILALWAFGTRQIVVANPSRVVRAASWTGGILAGCLILLLLSRRLFEPALVLFVASLAGGLVLSRLPSWSLRVGSAADGGKSAVETPGLRMNLDHESAEIGGTILAGRHAGRFLKDLDTAELLDLLRDLRVHDIEGAQLLEAYLRRAHPDVDLDPLASAASSSGEMTTSQALAILGLEPGAADDDVREAHRRLIRAMHPDQGGSDYLAAQINEARDVLLSRA